MALSAVSGPVGSVGFDVTPENNAVDDDKSTQRTDGRNAIRLEEEIANRSKWFTEPLPGPNAVTLADDGETAVIADLDVTTIAILTNGSGQGFATFADLKADLTIGDGIGPLGTGGTLYPNAYELFRTGQYVRVFSGEIGHWDPNQSLWLLGACPEDFGPGLRVPEPSGGEEPTEEPAPEPRDRSSSMPFVVVSIPDLDTLKEHSAYGDDHFPQPAFEDGDYIVLADGSHVFWDGQHWHEVGS